MSVTLGAVAAHQVDGRTEPCRDSLLPTFEPAMDSGITSAIVKILHEVLSDPILHKKFRV